MTNHIYIRISGFGLSLLPFTPFRAGRSEEAPTSLDIIHFASTGEKFARVIPDGSGGFTSKLDQNTPSLYDVVEISAGTALPKWTLETSEFTCDWPADYEIASTSFPRESTIIDLIGSNQQQIFIQSAQKVPALRRMPARGQRIQSLDEATGSIELHYTHQDDPWYQRHQIVRFGSGALIVSCQAPEPLASSTGAAAGSVAESIIFTPELG